MIQYNEINKIKQEKISQKLTTLQLAELSGVPVGTLNKILSGKTLSVKVETLKKLQSALKIGGVGITETKTGSNFGYVKVGAYTPLVKVADVKGNVEEIKKGIDEANLKNVKVLVFPELCITSYTCGDLFFQEALLSSAISGLIDIVNYSTDKDMLIFVGLPIRKDGALYNACAVICNGKLLAITPKSNITNFNDFYERRYFKGFDGENTQININGKVYPFGTNIIYQESSMQNFTVCAEICEDLMSSVSPSVSHAKAGAFIGVNLSSINETVGKSETVSNLVVAHTLKNTMGYVMANSGFGESTTDLVFAGHNVIVENGKILTESKLFSSGLLVSDIDVDYLAFERSKTSNFLSCENNNYTKINFELNNLSCEIDRQYSKTPFIPSDKVEISKKCELVLNLQAHALAQRVKHINAKSIVLGISGGLDSTLAILVAVRAMKILKRDTKDILAITMPCFGTTSRTKNNAEVLCKTLNVSFKEINIKEAVKVHFSDISHDINTLDITYENSQARERTQVLMDIANQMNGIVLGTGDLSELALGWATYNGDHMSMYGVNSSLPKTLIRYVVDYEANNSSKLLKDTLKDILDTPVSPELIPANGEDISQKTEDIVGPYLLHDFYLYYAIKMGFKPSKIYYIAKRTFKGVFDNETLYKWLKNFYNRFFNQQFKRSCMPDGVKVDEISLSPRGGFSMPSDAIKTEWIIDLDNAK